MKLCMDHNISLQHKCPIAQSGPKHSSTHLLKSKPSKPNLIPNPSVGECMLEWHACTTQQRARHADTMWRRGGTTGPSREQSHGGALQAPGRVYSAALYTAMAGQQTSQCGMHGVAVGQARAVE